MGWKRFYNNVNIEEITSIVDSATPTPTIRNFFKTIRLQGDVIPS